MHMRRVGWSFVWALLASPAAIWAQCGEPAADFCAAARVIPGTPGSKEVVMGVAAAGSDRAMACAVNVGHTVWFAITPEASGLITFSTCHPATTYDTAVQVWEGDCEFLAPVACVDDSDEAICQNGCSGRGSIVSFEGIAGHSYRIEVGSYNDNSAGCDLCLGVFAVIGARCGENPRDYRQWAREIPGTPGEHEFEIDASHATADGSMACHGNAGHSTWFRITPTVGGVLRFSTCTPATAFDTVVQALIPGDPFDQLIACNDDEAAGPTCHDRCSTVEFDVAAGTTYLVEVGSFNQNSHGCELCLGVRVSLQQVDGDADGIPDPLDLCPGHDDRIDSDGDAVPDGCDRCPGGDDAADADADGVPNACDAQPTFEPGAQMVALDTLRARSAREVEVAFERGIPVFVLAEIPVAPELPPDPVARSLGFLREFRDLYRLLAPPSNLYLNRIVHDGAGEWHLFYGQQYAEIPVFGSEIAVHLAGDRVTGTNGRYLPEWFGATPINIPRPTPGAVPIPINRPALGRADAEAIALAAIPGSSERVVGATRLTYVDEALMGGAGEAGTRLAWEVHAWSGSGAWLGLVDAQTGGLLYLLDRNLDADRPGEDFDIETANNTGESSTCWIFTTDDDQWFDEDGATGPADAEGWAAYNGTHDVYHFFYDNFGRRSYDNDEEDIEIYLDVRFEHGPNARYNTGCDIFEFWDGWSVLDVLAHEITHGVVRHTADLVYANQPGALNESLADIFGSMIENDCGGAPCVPQNWTMGEGSPLGAFRNLADPPALNQPDHMLAASSGDGRGLVSLPPGTAPTGGNDYGAVHTNSGILNKVYYLLMAGGTHNTFEIAAISPRAKLWNLYYHVLATRLTANSQFEDFRNEMVSSAKSRPDIYTRNDLCAIVNAFASVGLGAADRDCDGNPDESDPDDDNDGVPDVQDNCPRHANPGQSDNERDGIGDECDPDDDNDGALDDGDRNGVDYDNPCRAGTVANCDDNCPFVPNPSQADADGDGVGDSCEDEDMDGILTPGDNCPQHPNPWQDDNDGDGMGDECDSDDDNDGFVDDGDNCPFVPNPSQADADGDGVGDACDLCPNHADSANHDNDGDGLGDACDPDDDNDGVPDAQDNCPLVPNPDQRDTLKSGTGDACAVALALVEPLQVHRGFLRFGGPDPVIRLPVFPCSACPDYFGPDYVMQVRMQTPVAVVARIVDEEGLTVQKGPAGTAAVLQFHPAASTFFRPPTLPDMGLGAGVPEPFTGKQYTIEIYPSEAAQPGLEYPVTVEVRSGGEETVAGIGPRIVEFFSHADGSVTLVWDVAESVFVEFSLDPGAGDNDWLPLDGMPVTANAWTGDLPPSARAGFLRVRQAATP